MGFKLQLSLKKKFTKNTFEMSQGQERASSSLTHLSLLFAFSLLHQAVRKHLLLFSVWLKNKIPDQSSSLTLNVCTQEGGEKSIHEVIMTLK